MRSPNLPPIEGFQANEDNPEPRRRTAEPEHISDRITRVRWDLQNLQDFYNVRNSTGRCNRLMVFFTEELHSLEFVPFDMYNQDEKVDYLLLRNYLRYQILQLRHDADQDQRLISYLGIYFPMRLSGLIQARQRVDEADGKQAATWCAQIIDHIKLARDRIANKDEVEETIIALRATKLVAALKSDVQEWYDFYKDYDPEFTYWVAEPSIRLQDALEELNDTIKRSTPGLSSADQDTIIGSPIGRAGILDALQVEMIPYTPEELIAIGEKEYAWCETEMQKAASDLSFPTWRSALEYVKDQYVAPGKQPHLVRDLIKEATEYVEKYDRVTVPSICKETLRMYMMSPEKQKMNPFFLGGESIIVSYPTSTMSHEQKLMAMRGNNIHFSRATAFHETIPGHHLQWYYLMRSRPYRQMFFTPFSTEGWAFYWEMLLWDADDWPKTPENRIGMLFWRMHRCARIVFSLKYHLGLMTADECVELLVNWVGFERANAEGEVRRSVMGDYGPLYQAGYMLGGLQLYALRKEVVDQGQMDEKEFHDLFLRANQMPVELFAALIQNRKLSKDYESRWRFYNYSKD
ncbi:hypothetical protein BDV96DRAFT_588654 [Lophiotrema nucula]|uniref:X-Pro dipeptidyl-peptidase n=1 Tax=Lophiotrema nucula TaxID=690887 RepID=A0A6A5YLZ4_9PLEO|nr:hypothetical protein BDV96DRAFT_588654 [Lophiotrema nucula]